MSVDKPEIPYVRTTAQSLLNCEIPIPKDAEIKMLNLINETKKLKKQYDSLNRKYNLQRIIRIQGTDHQKNISKSSILDIFGADTSQRNLETLGEKIAQKLVDFAYLWDFFCKEKSVKVENSGSILLKNYKILDNFKNDYFGKECDFRHCKSKSGILTLCHDVINFDKGSVISKIKPVSDKFSSVEPTKECINFFERFRYFGYSNYINFISYVYNYLNAIESDKNFAVAKNAVSGALEDAKNQLIRTGNTIASNIDMTLHDFKDIALQYKNLNQSINQTERCISELGPIAKRINEGTIIKNFNKLCGNFKKVKEKFQTRDEEFYDIKSFLKRFNIGQYDNMNIPAVETNTRKFVIATKREAISLVKSIKKGSLSSIILDKLKCFMQTSEKMEEYVLSYLDSKYYANYSFWTDGNTSKLTQIDNSQLTVSGIRDWYFSKDQHQINPVCGYVIRISEDLYVNFIFSQKYSTIAKKLKKYCRKIYSNKTEIKNTKTSLEDLRNQIASIDSSSLKVSNETKLLVSDAVVNLSRIAKSLLTFLS